MPEEPVSTAYPFEAVVGLEDAKRALLCLAADRSISSVLIRGPSGTAKSVLVRSLPDAVGRRTINVPSTISDEQLFGGIDFEKAIESGRADVQGGLLQRADGCILLLDNANLMDPRRLSMILDCLDTGEVIVEREGVSASYPIRASVVATMDPLESEMGDAIADRFDICVSTYQQTDGASRSRVVSRESAYRDDPVGFRNLYSGSDSRVRRSVSDAERILPSVVISADMISAITGLCSDLGAEGHRGDISTARAAVALAALSGRTEVSEKDVSDAAVMCLAHRRGSVVPECSAEGCETDDDGTDDYRKEVFGKKTSVVEVPEEEGEDEPDEAAEPEVPEADDRRISLVREVIDRLDAIDEAETLHLHEIAGANLRRHDIVAGGGWGRYAGSRMPAGKVTDPALDATIRAAAPYQLSRASRGLSITIEPQDIREKVRTRRDGCSFLFVVDLSGSSVNDKMISHMNRAIKAMLRDGYVNRDRVALMTFNEHSVYLPVPFTRSAESICAALEQSPAGGCTPLGLALLEARSYMYSYVRRNPFERCFVMMMTDGETTKSVIPGNEATVELKKIAKVCNVPNTEWVVIDTKLGYSRHNNARRLAALLGSRYMTLDSLAEF